MSVAGRTRPASLMKVPVLLFFLYKYIYIYLYIPGKAGWTPGGFEAVSTG